MKCIVASYPRSGNHLVRGILEFGFRRPTLGDAGRRNRDGPIADRPPNAINRVIVIEDREPIGLKAHHLHSVVALRRRFADADQLLLVTRNPVDAISSHLLRRFSRWPWLPSRSLRLAVEQQANDWLGLLLLHQSWSEERRWHLEFERLIDRDRGLGYANALLERLNAPHRLDGAAWSSLQRVTKSSQRSLGDFAARRRLIVRAAVESQLNAADCLSLLRN